MDDSLAMRFIKRVRNLDCVLNRLVERERALLQTLGQRLPFEVLHDEEVDSILLTNVVEGTNVRMVECGHGAGFALEALATLRIRCNVREQDFDRDIATKASVSCSIDFSHSTRPNEREDLVRAETGARRKRHRVSVRVGRSYPLSGGEADQLGEDSRQRFE